MKTVIGKIPYLNSAPFYQGWEAAGFDWVETNPRQLGELARQGKIDGGLLSLYDYFTLEEDFSALDLGIAACGPVKSILLFSDHPLWDLGGKLIAVSGQTATSSRLLRLILEVKEKLAGLRYTADFSQKCSGMLLIGDEALAERRNRLRRCRHLYDLSECWHTWTGLPFVFALWAFRKTMPPLVLDEIRAQLESALKKNLADLQKVARTGPDELGSLEERTAYLKGVIYRLGPEEKKGLALFKSALVNAKMLEEVGAVV